MKRSLAVAVAIVALLGLQALDIRPLALISYAQQDPAKITVYITKTGEKYHRDGCRYLSRSKIPVSLKDALANRYGALFGVQAADEIGIVQVVDISRLF